MLQVGAEFSPEQVARIAVLATGSASGVADFAGDTGLRSPVALDLTEFADSSCWEVPPDDGSLYEHYRQRIGDPFTDPPFPLQVVLDGEGRIAYVSRDYRPDEVMEVLRELAAR